MIGDTEVGGIIGQYYQENITDSHNYGTISGNANTAGLFGTLYASSSATNSYNYKNVTSIDQVADIAGYLNGTLTNCDNFGSITATNNDATLFGPIYGNLNGGTATNCDDFS